MANGEWHLRGLRRFWWIVGESSEPRLMDRDLAPPVRPGVILAVFPSARPLKRGGRPLSRAVSSPPKALRGLRHCYRLSLYWLGRGYPLAELSVLHPLCTRCA